MSMQLVGVGVIDGEIHAVPKFALNVTELAICLGSTLLAKGLREIGAIIPARIHGRVVLYDFDQVSVAYAHLQLGYFTAALDDWTKGKPAEPLPESAAVAISASGFRVRNFPRLSLNFQMVSFSLGCMGLAQDLVAIGELEPLPISGRSRLFDVTDVARAWQRVVTHEIDGALSRVRGSQYR